MYNVDTLSLGMNLEERMRVTNYLFDNKNTIDYKYVRTVDKKIRAKLVLDENNRKKLKMLKEQQNMSRKLDIFYRRKKQPIDVYMYTKDKDYSFYYNITKHTLSINLKHSLIETHTAEEILEATKQEIMRYFDLTAEQLNPLILRRIDYYCDYKYQDIEEFAIIKNINTKIPQQIYSYKKEVVDDEKKYVIKYLSFKKSEDEYKEGVDTDETQTT